MMQTTRCGPRDFPVRAMRGQSLVELLVVAPVLFFLILAVIQAVLLYRTKATLDYAALMAARAGATSGLKKAEMDAAFAKGMMPLYAHKTGMTELQAAYVRARADLLLHGRIEIVSPTRAAWNSFKEKQYHDGKYQYVLPNDNPAYRSTAIKGAVNVQDANILKVRVVYDSPLVVPFVGLVLGGRSGYLKPDTAEGSLLDRLSGRLPIEASAMVRMQSPIGTAQAGALP